MDGNSICFSVNILRNAESKIIKNKAPSILEVVNPGEPGSVIFPPRGVEMATLFSALMFKSSFDCL